MVGRCHHIVDQLGRTEGFCATRNSTRVVYLHLDKLDATARGTLGSKFTNVSLDEVTM